MVYLYRGDDKGDPRRRRSWESKATESFNAHRCRLLILRRGRGGALDSNIPTPRIGGDAIDDAVSEDEEKEEEKPVGSSSLLVPFRTH